jgi:hypothetical protein
MLANTIAPLEHLTTPSRIHRITLLTLPTHRPHRDHRHQLRANTPI